MKSILSKLIDRKPTISDIESYSVFSVFVPIVLIDKVPHLLFEIRSVALAKQPNEICFPGGKIELGEAAQTAAIRETCEELLVAPDNIKIQCELDTVITPFNTIIYPFFGYLYDYHETFNTDEVKEVFYVPLSHLIDQKPSYSYVDVKMIPPDDFPFDMIQNGRNYPWKNGHYPVYFYTYKDKIIWGITARIIYNLVSIML